MGEQRGESLYIQRNSKLPKERCWTWFNFNSWYLYKRHSVRSYHRKDDVGIHTIRNGFCKSSNQKSRWWIAGSKCNKILQSLHHQYCWHDDLAQESAPSIAYKRNPYRLDHRQNHLDWIHSHKVWKMGSVPERETQGFSWKVFAFVSILATHPMSWIDLLIGLPFTSQERVFWSHNLTLKESLLPLLIPASIFIVTCSITCRQLWKFGCKTFDIQIST